MRALLPVFFLSGCGLPTVFDFQLGTERIGLVEVVFLTKTDQGRDVGYLVVGSSYPGLCDALRVGSGRKREQTLTVDLSAFAQSQPTLAAVGSYVVTPSLERGLARNVQVLVSRADDSCSNAIPVWAGVGRGGTVELARTTTGLDLALSVSLGMQNDSLSGTLKAVPCSVPLPLTLLQCR